MTVTVRIADPGAARATIARATSAVIKREMNVVGKLMVEDAVALMRGDFNLERPYERRRWPGSRRAASALDFTVTGGPEFPLELGWRVLGGDETFKKIVGLNWGVPGHNIKGGSGTWPLKGKFNVNRMGGAKKRKRGTNRRPDLLAWVDEDGDVMTPEVDHPGSEGGHFLEEALELAIFRLSSMG